MLNGRPNRMLNELFTSRHSATYRLAIGVAVAKIVVINVFHAAVLVKKPASTVSATTPSQNARFLAATFSFSSRVLHIWSVF
jgi:hypothetical protein